MAGTTVVSATSNISVGGQSITRTTNTAVNTAAGGSGNALKNWTSLASGRVTGGGSIFATVNGVPNVRVTHGFELRCDPNDKRQSLEINWDGGNNFHLDKIINSVVCFDDPTTQPPPPPGTVIDTYAGNTLFNGHAGYHGFGYAVGTGTCNKQPGDDLLHPDRRRRAGHGGHRRVPHRGLRLHARCRPGSAAQGQPPVPQELAIRKQTPAKGPHRGPFSF